MGSETKIQWADHTFNPWRVRGDSRVVASEATWRDPIKWDREAAKTGERHRVFCASLADVFEDWQGQCQMSDGGWCVKRRQWGEVTGYGSCALSGGNDAVKLDDVRARLAGVWDATPNLDWLVLTKRPENIRRMWPPLAMQRDSAQGPYRHAAMHGIRRIDQRRDNLWLGVSIACRADLRLLDDLRKCRDLCAKTFVSAEPLLEDLGTIDLTGIDWVIVGGESGPNARPCHVDLGGITGGGGDSPWPTDDPKGGDPAEWPEDLRVREVPS